VPPDDAGALAGAVAGLLADPVRARRLAVAGRRRAQTWPDAADTARRVLAVYRELLGPPGPS
jgi:glycosyltransferase involved in cell wall biosynthesis